MSSKKSMLPPRTDRSEWLSRRAALASLAILPAALPGAAAAEPDPIFAVIQRHRDLSDHYSAATAISAKLPDGPEFEAADKVSGERGDALSKHTDVLIRSEPTTMAGIAALTRYAASLANWQVPSDEDWPQVLLGTLANAFDSILQTEG
ncbi:hypothetical protein [Bradyrhizobium sp. Ec3.3]|uniref:hypothetical protein n=1 Tax=Bradyrhizobium sp. Ec3.3 TaxID=189753 RepID=UPI001FD8801D|nr:hypothetical protein [Bradyrhizobium sp. Ec3.3]